jgi:hypothetical protein
MYSTLQVKPTRKILKYDSKCCEEEDDFDKTTMF